MVELPRAYAASCGHSVIVVRELLGRFSTPIPKAVVQGIRFHGRDWPPPPPPPGGFPTSALEAGYRHPHAPRPPQPPPPYHRRSIHDSIKVLHLVRDPRGVLLSRLKTEAWCGDESREFPSMSE